ncbi:MAG: pantetheine-phosphate adenylyltransferase [Planctomycetota bacterium]
MGRRVAVYPGSFDPITLGHLDVIERGCRIFDELVVAVARNRQKKALFAFNERIDMIRRTTSCFPNVRVDSFRGLVVDYVRSIGAGVILRGIRTVGDFEYEFQMALTNRELTADVETVFIMARQEFSFIHASVIKEIVALGGDASSFLPEYVEKKLRAKLT